jgi:hypothetical protein
MFGAFTSFGKLGSLARAIAAAWTPAALWPTGTEPGMWIDPSNLTSQWQDSAGTTPVSPPGTVADSSNPVGLALDLRLGATALTDPGNHLLQATSTARPLESARVNLMIYTEDFSGPYWAKDGVTLTGTNIISETVDNAPHRIYQNADMVVGVKYECRVRLKAGTSKYGYVFASMSGGQSSINLETGVIFSGSGTSTAHADGSYTVTVSGTYSSYNIIQIGLTNASGDQVFVGNPANNLQVISVDLRVADGGASIPLYQAVPGDGSTYTSTGFPYYEKYDGTDDGMATASFAAGTLSNNMDCLIAVRRGAAALPEIYGFYQADNTKYFGVTSEYSPHGLSSFSGCGSPTVWVDGTQLPGGTAVDRGAMNDALTRGPWHILEFRGLDLSTWDSVCWGGYTAYCVNGTNGGILLFPGGNTAGRDAARAWLAAKVGVTLP